MVVWLIGIGAYVLAIICLLAIVGSRRRKLERCLSARRPSIEPQAAEEFGEAAMGEGLVRVPASGTRHS